jgi:sugar/nucleoside kinase (ribokinase family)
VERNDRIRGVGPLVLVVGDVMNDVVVRPREHFSPATDTASEIEWSPGGSAANQAAWLGYLVGRARFAGRAGKADAAAHRQALAALGVDAHIAEDEAARSGTVVVIVSAEGERSMYTDRAANAALGPQDLDPTVLLDGVGLLHISGYTLFETAGRAGAARLTAAAMRSGIPVSVDPASTAGLRSAGASSFFEWTSGAELLFPNLDEGRYLAGADDPEEVVSVLLGAYRVVALKLGEDGCLVGSAAGERVRIEGSAGAEVGVDSTGAGDAFCAGFLARWVERAGLEECAASAMAAAGEAIRRLGARPVGQRSP